LTITDNFEINVGKIRLPLELIMNFHSLKMYFFGNNFGSYTFRSLDDFFVRQKTNYVCNELFINWRRG
jgi:hypothetical protein